MWLLLACVCVCVGSPADLLELVQYWGQSVHVSYTVYVGATHSLLPLWAGSCHLLEVRKVTSYNNYLSGGGGGLLLKPFCFIWQPVLYPVCSIELCYRLDCPRASWCSLCIQLACIKRGWRIFKTIIMAMAIIHSLPPFNCIIILYSKWHIYPPTHTHTQHTHTHRILLRSSDHYLHGLLSITADCKTVTVEDTVRALAKEVGLMTAFKLATYPDIEKELLRIDEVRFVLE